MKRGEIGTDTGPTSGGSKRTIPILPSFKIRLKKSTTGFRRNQLGMESKAAQEASHVRRGGSTSEVWNKVQQGKKSRSGHSKR